MWHTVFKSNFLRHSWKRSSKLLPRRSMTITWNILPSSVFSSPTKWRNGTWVLPRILWMSLDSQNNMIWRCILTAFSYQTQTQTVVSSQPNLHSLSWWIRSHLSVWYSVWCYDPKLESRGLKLVFFVNSTKESVIWIISNGFETYDFSS